MFDRADRRAGRRRFLALSVALLLLLPWMQSAVMADTEDVQYTLPEGYDMTVASATEESALIWSILMENIGNPYGVAGIMGNLSVESGLRANNLQDVYTAFTDNGYTSVVDGGAYSRNRFINDEYGYGLAQWTHYSFKKELYDYVKARGYSIGNAAAQTEYLLHSLKQPYYASLLSELQNAGSVSEATLAFLLRYERPAEQGLPARLHRTVEALRYFSMYAKETVPVSGELTKAYTTVAKHGIFGNRYVDPENVPGVFVALFRR